MPKLRVFRQPLSYSYPEAAEATGISEAVLREAVGRGDLIRRYPSSKPVILATELQEWLESLPLSRPIR